MLCELLPVGIPSLAVCLQSLLQGTVSCSCQEEGGDQGCKGRVSLGLDCSLSAGGGVRAHSLAQLPIRLLPAQVLKPQLRTGRDVRGCAPRHSEPPKRFIMDGAWSEPLLLHRCPDAQLCHFRSPWGPWQSQSGPQSSARTCPFRL